MFDMNVFLEVVPHRNLNLLARTFHSVLSERLPARDNQDGRLPDMYAEVPEDAVKIVSILVILRVPRDDVEGGRELEDAMECQKLQWTVELEQCTVQSRTFDDGVHALENVKVVGISNQHHFRVRDRFHSFEPLLEEFHQGIIWDIERVRQSIKRGDFEVLEPPKLIRNESNLAVVAHVEALQKSDLANGLRDFLEPVSAQVKSSESGAAEVGWETAELVARKCEDVERGRDPAQKSLWERRYLVVGQVDVHQVRRLEDC